MPRAGSAALLILLATTATPADTLRSGSLRVDVTTAPFALTFASDDGPVLSSAPDAGPGSPSALAVRTPAGWVHATTVSSTNPNGRRLRMVVQTDDPQGATFALRLRPAGEGIIEVEASYSGSAADILGIGAAWATTPDERFFGFGERANAVEHRGARVESYVSDGPYDGRRPRVHQRRPAAAGISRRATTPPTSRCRGSSRAAATACWSTTTRPSTTTSRRPGGPTRGASRSSARPTA